MAEEQRSGAERWLIRRGRVVLVAFALALFIGACGGDDDEDEGAATDTGAAQAEGVAWDSSAVSPNDMPSVLQIPNETDPTIPSAEVTLATAPYNDHSYAIIGVENGWFEDAGIAVTLQASDIPQIAPGLLSGQLDVGTMCASCWVPTLDQTTENKMMTFSDTFVGTTILGNPDGNYSTTEELVASGMEFEEALTQAMGQLEGKEFYYSTNPSTEPFRAYLLDVAGLEYSDFEGGTLEDLKIVELATAGRADFVQVAGGPQTVRLLADGWAPIITAREIFDQGDRRALAASDFFSGWAANEAWLADNHETALRMASVMYRIIDEKLNNFSDAAAIQMPYLNSLAGTDFGEEEARFLDEIIDPFWSFDDQATFFEDEESIYYYQLSLQALIDRQVDSGVLTNEHSPDEFVLADDIWRELKDLRAGTDEIYDEVSAELESSPNAEAQELLDQSQEYYDARNYLDAFRFANAAQLQMQS